MSDPIKILHAVYRMGRGGSEMRTLELMRQVDRRRYQFHFCALSGKPGELDEEVRRLGGEVHLLRRGPVGFPARFRRLVRQHRFDVVHSHVLYYAGVLLRLASQAGAPLRVAFFRSSHDGRGDHVGRRAYRGLMRRWIDRHATHIEAVGEGAMAAAWGADWRTDPRCQVIYDGFSPAQFNVECDQAAVRSEFGIGDGGPLCIHVGRMSPPKNHRRLMEVFAQVVRRRPDARLLLVGRGGNGIEADLRRRVAELNVGGAVVFCGERSDVPRLLAAADVLLFPSLWEGLPGAVLEACAMGIPVLASDLPGVREIAARLPGVRCLPLDLDDGAWGDTLLEIADQPISDAMRQPARRRFAESVFTIEQCAASHCLVWDSHRSDAEFNREMRAGA